MTMKQRGSCVVNMNINSVAIYLPVFLILITTQSLLGDDWSASCPSNCTCKWTNGKKSAICSSLQLTTIPTTLSTEIQVLVLNENHISYLNREEFITLGLLNLQRIYLKKSNLQYVHKEAFKNLKILVEIDLSDNKIEMLDKDTFNGNDRLRILYLNGNPLKKLTDYQFPTLPHLRTLDLHDCLINYIDPLTFANLNLLEYLNLKNNLLENLPEYVFQHMENLKTLILDENPWQCNCKLRKFRNWYIQSKVNSISLNCMGPYQYKDKFWENIDEKHFGCQPKVEIFNNDDIQNIDVGTNTTFSCLVYGDPLPEVTWELNGKNFDNDNILFDQENIASDKLWSNLTVFNMTSLDAGTYACSAQNVVGSSSQNVSIYLTEIVQHVLVKTPETFWYFGLIMGTFGTVFLLILLSFVVCLCKRTSRRRRHPRKAVKSSVSFNDQEKKLLDLSITTTTNDRGDSCGIENNTPSINKTESVIGFEPIEITVENRGGVGGGCGGSGVGGVGVSGLNMGIQSGGCGIGPNGGIIQMVSGNSNNNSGGVGGNNNGGMISSIVGNNCNANGINDEFPLNVGVFPPPPEFCSNVVPNPAYGNIFISVSVTQDMLDSSDINIYPDLLNIPKRVDNGQMVPVNVASFATLPRNNHRRGILKKDNTATTNLYPHDEIVSYHNLETSYSQGYQEQQLPSRCLQGQQQQKQLKQQHNHHHQQQQQHIATSNVIGGGTSSSCGTSTITTLATTHKTNCANCLKSSQPHSYVKDAVDIDTTSSGGVGGGTAMRTLCSTGMHQQSNHQPSCLKYDNMGRRITASGNSTLSLPDEERMEEETLFNESIKSLRNFSKQQQQQQQQQQPQQQNQLPPQSQTSTTQTSSSQDDSSANDFVSL